MNYEWFSGFLSGFLATLLGFGLTMLWDIYKQYQGVKQERIILLKAIRQECNDNLDVCKYNYRLLQEQLAVVGEGKTIVVPIILMLNTSMWELSKIRLPAMSEADLKLLQDLAQCKNLAEYINETIHSRQIYMMTNQAMSNFSVRLEMYDIELSKSHLQLSELLKQFEATVISSIKE